MKGNRNWPGHFTTHGYTGGFNIREGSKRTEDKAIILNLSFIADALLPLLSIYGVPATGETSRWRETPQLSLFWSWPWLVFSLAAQPAVRLSWREASTASVSQESFIITYQRAESVSLSLWEVTKTPERKISGFKNRGLFCRNREADPKNWWRHKDLLLPNDFEKEQIRRTSTTRFQNFTIKLYVTRIMTDRQWNKTGSLKYYLRLQPVDFAMGIQWERAAF